MSEGFKGYSGQDFTLRGVKGRFVLPPAFRNAVKASSGDNTLCLTAHDRWDCLVGFGLSRQEEFEGILDREEESAFKFGREFDRETRAIQLNSFRKMPFDDSGRFIMPDYLQDLGAIEDRLFFQGGGTFFTIWNPAKLYEMGKEMAVPKAACRALEIDAMKGKKK